MDYYPGRTAAGSLRRVFVDRFGNAPRIFRAPGRVNIIGEHTDYNDGFVLPMPIDRDTIVAGSARADRLVVAYSLDAHEELEFNLEEPYESKPGSWLNHVEGMARVLESSGVRLKGANLLIRTELPIGSGLSSSAALQISTGFALLRLSGLEPDLVALARAGQKAEHQYVGARVGIMDQLAASVGARDTALLIDCRSLKTTKVPLQLGQFCVLLCNTNVRHRLSASQYNRRRAECEEGVRLLKQYLPNIAALRDVSLDELNQYGSALPEVIRKRCRHVITENLRTLDATQALEQRQISRLGELLFQSHASLRDDYEVSCRELDLLVEFAAEVEKVAGARMTGGGFGGCTLNLVDKNVAKDFCSSIRSLYLEATGTEAAIYIVGSGEGVGEISSRH